MNKEVTKQKKNVTEKTKIKKALDALKNEDKAVNSRQAFYWRKSNEPFFIPMDLRNPARH